MRKERVRERKRTGPIPAFLQMGHFVFITN